MAAKAMGKGMAVIDPLLAAGGSESLGKCIIGTVAGDLHDIYALRVEKYLLSLALQILSAGTDVILDWGLWTKAQRSRLRAFWNENHIANEIHYLKLSPSEWERRISKRNAEINKQEPSAYEVDEGLLKKTESLFEEPSEEEVDRIVVQ